MSVEEFARKIGRLNVNITNGRASPHKVCMLLALMDMARSGALVENRIEYGPVLLERYTRYFNAVRTQRDHLNPYFPFFHLQGKLRGNEESFWHLVPRFGREQFLAEMKTARSTADITDNVLYATLDPELFALLQDGRATDALAEALSLAWFDRGLRDLDAVVAESRKINRYESELRALAPALAVSEDIPAYVRDPAFRLVVTEIYDFRCAATGLRIIINGTAMVEAAHIHPVCEAGDNDPRNGLALTPDMHWAMDKYLIAPGPDYRWHVSPTLDDRIPDHRVLTDLKGKPLFLPRQQRMYPKQDVLQWRLDRLELM